MFLTVYVSNQFKATRDVFLVPQNSVLWINETANKVAFRGAGEDTLYGEILDEEIEQLTIKRTPVPAGLTYDGRPVLWIEETSNGYKSIATLADDGSGILVFDGTDTMHGDDYQRRNAADPNAVEQAAARAVDPTPSAKTA